MEHGPNDLLDTKEAAAILGLHPGSLKRWRRRGKGPPYLLLGEAKIRYRYSAVQNWLDLHKQIPTSA